MTTPDPTLWACCVCDEAGTGNRAAEAHTRATHHPTTTGTDRDRIDRFAAAYKSPGEHL